MNTLWIRHQTSLLVFIGVLIVIGLSNLRALRRLGHYPLLGPYARLSVLVPARNEELNVRPCVHSLLRQTYPDFEVLVLDDDSDDSTAEVLSTLRAEDTRLLVLAGQPLPSDWLGKHWACHQLAEAATGDLLLFVDADTRCEPDALRHAVSALERERADMVSVVPRQEVVSWGERLVVPVMTWSIFSFLPLALAHRTQSPALSAAVGQFMLFRRSAYQAVGGHLAVRHDIVDDIALGRRVKGQGFRWRLVDGHDQVRCRMYHGFRGAVQGFGKGLFAAFGYNAPLFTFVWVWLAVVAWEPLTVLVIGAFSGGFSAKSMQLAGGAAAASTGLWAMTAWRFGYPLYISLLHPISLLLTLWIALRSMVLTLRGRGIWKGRPIPHQRAARKPRRRGGHGMSRED